MELTNLPKGVSQEQAKNLMAEAIGSTAEPVYMWSAVQGLVAFTDSDLYYVDFKNPEKKNQTIPIAQMTNVKFSLGVMTVTGDFKQFVIGCKKEIAEQIKQLAPELALPLTEGSTVNRGVDSFFDETKIVYSSVTTKYGFNRPSQEVFRNSSTSGKPPWLVVAAGTDGALAAYEDELIIAKTGAMTGFMSSATGGGRITHFPYSQIVSIEYNGGFINGVLEILTASYDGGMNKDFWGFKSSNSSAGDPRQQNNTLPIIKRVYNELAPDLNKIRQLMTRSNEVKISVDSIAVAPAQNDVVKQIKELSELKDAGILTHEEFEAAKLKLLRQI